MSDPGVPRDRIEIDSIRIDRAPGIDGGFTLSGFGAGVTVIHGPNGSGKSTTARALHSLFWPDLIEDDCRIEATVRHNGHTWTIRRDGRRRSTRRDGTDCPPLTFAHLTPETRDRYHLALHDLLREHDDHFATLVTREASGGYDLEDAAGHLALERSLSASSHTTALRRAKEHYSESLTAQRSIATEEARLNQLEAESERARLAGLAILKLNAIKEALAARADLADALAAVNAYDTGMHHVRSADALTLTRWNADERELRWTLDDLDGKIARSEARRQEIGLPLDRDCAREVRLLEARLTALFESEKALAEAETALAAARTHERALQAEVAPLLPEPLQTERAAQLLRRYAAALDRQAEAERFNSAERLLAEWMPRPEAVPDAGEIADRLRLLAEWLQTPPPAEIRASSRWVRLVALLGALVVLGAGILLGREWHQYAYALVAIGGLLGLLALLLDRPAPPVDERIRIAEEIERSSHEAPDVWSVESVAQLFQTTRWQLQEAERAGLDANFWRTLEPRLREREQAIADAAAQRDALEAELGAEVTLDQSALAFVTTSLDNWLNAAQDAARLERRRDECAAAVRARLEAFNSIAGSLNATPVEAGDEAHAALESLRERLVRLIQATAARDEAIAARDGDTLPALQRIDEGRTGIIQRYGGRSLNEIERLAAQHDAWVEALRLHRDRRDDLARHRARLDPDTQLDEWTDERVEAEIADNHATQQQSASVNQEIGRINHAIETAKGEARIAGALLEIAAARDALAERRDAALQRAVGKLVLDEVRRQTREANLPDVARRARSLFARFTHGRYELQFNPGPPPAFTALNTGTGRHHTLNELSSATRVQLLIAVRTAFVEQNEADACLPLIFDETLANADAARAEALIETSLQIAEDGRQIFYFTAQHDEVEKWRQLAERRQTPISVIDLADQHRLAGLDRPALIDLPLIARRSLPLPDGHSSAAYRRIIGAPPLNPFSVDGGDIHLWHLIDDLDELYRLIAERHVSTWGQVRQLSVNGHAPAIGIDHDRHRVLSVRAEVCLALIEASRVGRGRPVTAADLRASGAVSGTYVERCEQLLDACNGDGARFIARIETGALSGFRRNRIDQLRAFFEENGHIATAEPLSADDIRARVAVRANDAIVAGLIDLATIDRLIAEGFTSPRTPDDPRHSEVSMSNCSEMGGRDCQ